MRFYPTRRIHAGRSRGRTMPDMFRPCSYLPLASPGLDGVVFHVKLAASPHRASTETRAPPLLTRVVRLSRLGQGPMGSRADRR